MELWSLNGFARTVETAVHELAHFYEGMDPFQIETIYQRMARDSLLRWGPDSYGGGGGDQVACWDIIGKEVGRPIYDLLGGRYHESLPAYANGWYQGGTAYRHVRQVRPGRGAAGYPAR
ncbi:MAG: hypothetical protein R2839_00750 [Thermomicrobiales bacterium]